MSDDPIAILTASRTGAPEHSVRPHLWPLIIIVLTLLAVAVSFFGDKSIPAASMGPSATQTTERQPRVYVISYRYSVFSPTNLRIHIGDTVRFRNDSPVPVHIIAQLQTGANTPDFDSVGDVQPGSYFSYTFPTAGIFAYYNYANSDESGVVIVR